MITDAEVTSWNLMMDDHAQFRFLVCGIIFVIPIRLLFWAECVLGTTTLR